MSFLDLIAGLGERRKKTEKRKSGVKTWTTKHLIDKQIYSAVETEEREIKCLWMDCACAESVRTCHVKYTQTFSPLCITSRFVIPC